MTRRRIAAVRSTIHPGVLPLLLALIFAGSTVAIAASVASAASAEPVALAPAPVAFQKSLKDVERRPGLLVTGIDRKTGRLWLELPSPSGRDGVCGAFLHLEGIRTGLGSNPVGLDRGQLGDARVVQFRRIGGRVLLEQQNLRYRALSADSAEIRAVRESFATSILWAGAVAAETPDGRILVDFTSAIVRDAHDVAATLKATGQREFKLDAERSTLDPANCLAFPDNLEFEALLTFASDEPGAEVRATAPTPGSVTITQHQSLVRLPPAGYRPRAYDARSGSFAVLFADYARPVGEDLDVRWLVRHRLKKVDPTAAQSRVVTPIVYYVDSGAPEPIRSALVEGASWWSRAFEAAGFIDAFQVRLLPPDVNPLDVRYNVIQWVHRATRGWSYGGGVIDPRTGEMIKGHVTLGSLRIRQDRMIFEGLLGAANTGTGRPDDPVELSLARIRQLAAHEVGHTLGFNHNFAASTYGDRASVMDYPAPLVTLREDGTLDASRAYTREIGIWDIQATRYAYTEFPPGADEGAGLKAILTENIAKGYVYLSDDDARPAGSAHPRAALWDNGSDPIAELRNVRAVRSAALRRFGASNLRPGAPLEGLGALLMPLYFHARYEIEACAKLLGGMDYSYAARGDGSPPPSIVSVERQRAALDALLDTLEPAELDLPETLLAQLLPSDSETPPHVELLAGRSWPAFDALGAAAAAADLTLGFLLPPERLARLVDFHRRDPAQLSVEELLEALRRRVLVTGAKEPPRLAEIRRTVLDATVRRLLAAAAEPAQAPAARAALEDALERFGSELDAAARSGEPADRALRKMLAADIRRHRERPTAPAAPVGVPPPVPPGSPIGLLDDPEPCGWPGR